MSTYPKSVSTIESWADENKVPRGEATRRFVQFATLESIAAAEIGQHVALKGGNALRFVHGSFRSTLDLDYTVTDGLEDTPESMREAVEAAVKSGFPRFGIKGKVQSVRRLPPGKDKTLPTYRVRVGFQLPWDKHFHGFEKRERPVSTVVEVELSLNDVVCETEVVALEGGHSLGIRVCSLEDIVAEKLRALLQQVPRKRYRPQDVYDIATICRAAELDLAKTASFFAEKCRARGIEVRKGAFDDDVRGRAERDYGNLATDLGDAFVPFDAAWKATVDLVESLPIPE